MANMTNQQLLCGHFRSIFESPYHIWQCSICGAHGSTGCKECDIEELFKHMETHQIPQTDFEETNCNYGE